MSCTTECTYIALSAFDFVSSTHSFPLWTITSILEGNALLQWDERFWVVPKSSRDGRPMECGRMMLESYPIQMKSWQETLFEPYRFVIFLNLKWIKVVWNLKWGHPQLSLNPLPCVPSRIGDGITQTRRMNFGKGSMIALGTDSNNAFNMFVVSFMRFKHC